MKLSIVETHAHLDMDAFDKDRAEVIRRAIDAGVGQLITIGIDMASSRQAIKLAEEYPQIYATVGFHPHEAGSLKAADMAELEKIASHPRVKAIGEIGLDFYRNRAPPEAQRQALEWQLGLAVKLDLPIVIHCRQAEKDMLALLHDWTSRHKETPGQPRGVIHCFNGEAEAARQYLDMGFFISLGAYIGYPSSRSLRDVIRSVPDDRLVVETDCPFLPPQSHRGQRNEPAYLPMTIAALAEIRQVPAEIIARQTTENAHQLFRIAPAGE